MKKGKKIAKKLKKGMSLVEVMIWVVIAGIVGGGVMLGSSRLISRARTGKATNELSVFSSALLQYKNEEGAFPTAEEGLNILIEKGYVKFKTQNGELLDPWKKPYIYESINEGEGFIVKSLGSDKVEGGTGDKADIITEESVDDFE